MTYPKPCPHGQFPTDCELCEMAAEIARLREIVAGVDDGGHWYSQQTMDARVAEIARLTADLEKCREDADRLVSYPIRRSWAMPNSNTFDVRPIGEFVRKYLFGLSVDPFARDKRWATHTNDLNPSTMAEHHMDACAFLELLHSREVIADCILLDPPYSPRQISECYAAAGLKAGMKDTQNAALYARVRKEAMLLCKPGTIVLSFGWNSAGMGPLFETLEILLVAHGGAHNDTICVAQRMKAPEAQLDLASIDAARRSP